jgi:hypothetical protein
MRRFDIARLRTLYGTRAGYLKRLGVAADAAVAARTLEPADAVALKAQAAKTVPLF